MPSHRSQQGLSRPARSSRRTPAREGGRGTGLKNQEVPARARHLVEPLRSRPPARAGREGPGPRIQGVSAGAAGVVRGASARADQARSASRHRPDRAPRAGSGSPEPLGEILPRRSDASASAGRRERLERFPCQTQRPDGVLYLDRRLVCRDARVPCDDTLPNGEAARPDGVHYSQRPSACSPGQSSRQRCASLDSSPRRRPRKRRRPSARPASRRTVRR